MNRPTDSQEVCVGVCGIEAIMVIFQGCIVAKGLLFIREIYLEPFKNKWNLQNYDVITFTLSPFINYTNI